MRTLTLSQLKPLVDSGNIPHAWLLTGTGQRTTWQQAGRALMQWALCEAHAEQDEACGLCKSCQLFMQDVHPDYRFVTCEKDSQVITVEQIRQIQTFVQDKPQIGARKWVLIDPAETMNVQAANALLKTLEEPVSNTILCLSTPHVALLPQTIISRCLQAQIVTASEPDAECVTEMREILQDLSDVWVSKVQSFDTLAESWVQRGSVNMLYWIWIIVAELLLYRKNGSVGSYGILVEAKSYYQQLAKCLPDPVGWTVLEQVTRAKQHLSNKVSVNMQCIFENILLTAL